MTLEEYLKSLNLAPGTYRNYLTLGRNLVTAIANQSGIREGQESQPITGARLEQAADDCGLPTIPGFFLDWMRTLV